MKLTPIHLLRGATMAVASRLSAVLPYAAKQALKDLPGILSLRLSADAVRRGNLVDENKKVCVDGFPRSANTYALNLLTSGLGIPERDIAHHTHSVANVRRALARGIPTFVLIRRPLECCSSLVAFGASRSLDDSLRAYAAFYESIMPLRDRITIVESEAVIDDPRAFLEQIGRAMRRHHPLSNVSEMTATIATTMRQRGERTPHRSPMPNAVKDRMKNEMLEDRSSPTRLALVARCENVRNSLLSAIQAK